MTIIGQENVCVQKDLVCPITSLTAAGSVNEDEQIKIGESVFKINRESGESYLVNFQVSINGFQCLNTNTFPLRKNYPALKLDANGCDDYGDVAGWSKHLKDYDQDKFYK